MRQADREPQAKEPPNDRRPHDRGRGPSEALRRAARRPLGRPRRCLRAPSSACSAPTAPGKSTTVRMLTTMTRPDAGTARVGGLDVVTNAADVRRIIGVTGQDAIARRAAHRHPEPDAWSARCRRCRRRTHAARAEELLEQFELTLRRRPHGEDLLGRHAPPTRPRRQPDGPPAGAVPRRADHRPRPDEPASACGTSSARSSPTAPPCCSPRSTSTRPTRSPTRISVIDHGTVIAEGTAAELKASIGGEQLEVTPRRRAPATPPVRSLRSSSGAVQVARRRSTCSRRRSYRAPGSSTAVIRALDDAGVAVDDVEIHHPSLDDVFFALTGHPAEEPASRPADRRLSWRSDMTATVHVDSPAPTHGRPRPVATRRRSRAQPRARAPRAGAALRRDRAAGAVHRAVRLHLRRRDGHSRRRDATRHFAIGGLVVMNLTTSSMGTAVGLSSDLTPA